MTASWQEHMPEAIAAVLVALVARGHVVDAVKRRRRRRRRTKNKR